MSGLQWFALEPNHGTNYGALHKRYKFKREPKLLDIGNGDIRVMIENKITEEEKKGEEGEGEEETKTKTDIELFEYCDPNTQYSGGGANKKCHGLIQKYFGNDYDGTIIDENNLRSNTLYSEFDLDSVSEIVIWKDYDDLLYELGDDLKNDLGDGIKSIRKNKSSRKNKSLRKNKSIRKNKTNKIKWSN